MEGPYRTSFFQIESWPLQRDVGQRVYRSSSLHRLDSDLG